MTAVEKVEEVLGFYIKWLDSDQQKKYKFVRCLNNNYFQRILKTLKTVNVEEEVGEIWGFYSKRLHSEFLKCLNLKYFQRTLKNPRMMEVGKFED